MGKHFTKEEAAEAGRKSRRGKSLKNQQWSVLGASIMSEHTDRFNGLLNSLPDKDFINAYLSVLNYFKPKLKQVEMTGDEAISHEDLDLLLKMLSDAK